MIKSEEVFRIGRIGKPHGIQGEVSMHFDDDVFDRQDAEYLILEIDKILVPFFMESYRFRSDSTVLIKFCGIETLEQARELTNSDVFFERDKIDSSDDELSWAQIVGFTVVNAVDNQPVGSLLAVDNSTINTLFEVETANRGIVLMPASDELIVEISTADRRIVLEIPEGLLTMN